ncbi:MAG: glycosyltransferase [Candidatus Aminicenantes bacterium]|nr:MAG: glycosyltransferase [Candidatus Aminicenantes bacterium]
MDPGKERDGYAVCSSRRDVLKPIRVAHLIETMHTGGAESVVASLINHQDPLFESMLICLKESGTAAIGISRKDVEIIELGKREGNDLAIPFRLAKLLKERNISILHTHNWSVFCEGMTAAVLARIPVRVHTVHGDFGVYPKGISYRFKEFIRHAVESLLTRATVKIVAVSDDVRRMVCEKLYINPRKIVIVNNGVDVCEKESFDFRRNAEDVGGKREHIIVSVGRLAEVKNVPMLLHAVSKVDVPFPFRLLLLGDGPERKNLQQIASDLGISDKVEFLGNRLDVRAILKGSELFVLASMYEGISMSILEAMAMGLPVVATNVGGNPGVIAEGESGYLVNPDDSAAMAMRISNLLLDKELRLRMGRMGRRIVEDKFSTRRMVRDYEKIYLSLLPAG